MKKPKPPKDIWLVWDDEHGAVVVFTQKTYAKREASEARRGGMKVVALRYSLAKGQNVLTSKGRRS